MKALACLLIIGAAYGQGLGLSEAPDVSVYEGQRFWSRFARNYLPGPVRGTSFTNSDRLDQLMRSGNIYLSLQDAIALALENNLDIESHRYDRREAETDTLRAGAGQLLRFQSSRVSTGFSSASSGITSGGLGSIGGGGGIGGQNGILSGFSIQAAGSGIPNLEPFAFFSWNGTHNTNIVTTAYNIGANYIVSSAHTTEYGFQKSFWTGTTVVMDMYTQSLSQNSAGNQYNPSLKGNLQLNISQPLLQGFGIATNKREVFVARNNLVVADLNFKEQVMATVKNVIDLYWDFVSLRDNEKVKGKSLDLAQRLLEDNRKRMRAGAIAPIDIIQAEAGYETAQLDLRNARAALQQQELIVKSALTRTGIDNIAIVDAHIIPTDYIVVPETETIRPMQDLVGEALERRPELKETALNMENSRLQIQGVKNAMRPNLSVDLNLQNNGLAGVANSIPIPTAADGTPLVTRPPPTAYFLGGWGSVVGQVFNRNFPTYSLGFNLTVPLHNTAARADMIKNQLDYRKLEIDRKQQENAIRLSVVNARISLEQARAAYETAVKARKLTEQTFAGTQKKYEMGTSTFTDVQIGQRDVVTAQAAETQSSNTYIKARNNLDMVLGSILDLNHVNIDEAYRGRVTRPAGPIPVL